MIDESELAGLLEDVRAGRDGAFPKLVANVQDQVRSWAARYVPDADSADDVAQEVLIGLERGIQRYEGRSRFSTWLFSVTRNAAINHLRGEQRRSALASRIELPAAAPEPATDSTDVANLVLTHFDALPPRQRQVFELVDLRGHDPAEVARQLGMLQVTVRAHLFKARRSIRRRMLANHGTLIAEWLS